jgi:hypothetical protein
MVRHDLEAVVGGVAAAKDNALTAGGWVREGMAGYRDPAIVGADDDLVLMLRR